MVEAAFVGSVVEDEAEEEEVTVEVVGFEGTGDEAEGVLGGEGGGGFGEGLVLALYATDGGG